MTDLSIKIDDDIGILELLQNKSCISMVDDILPLIGKKWINQSFYTESTIEEINDYFLQQFRGVLLLGVDLICVPKFKLGEEEGSITLCDVCYITV